MSLTVQNPGSGGGSSSPAADTTVYSTPGTFSYDIPAGAKMLDVSLCAGGGGGGAGFSQNTAATAAGGGTGGAGGGRDRTLLDVSQLSTPITVIVGAGGTGGISAAANGGTQVTVPTKGGDSSFGDFITLVGGGLGIAGVNGTGTATGPSASTACRASFTGTNGGNAVGGSAGSSGQNLTVADHGGTGGGGGGGITAGGAALAGGTSGTTASTGSPWQAPRKIQTPGGASDGLSGGNGGTMGLSLHGRGGGGGAGGITAAGGAGGTGAQPGGGGGGGGAAGPGFRAGNGGAGGNGVCIITALMDV